jgi:folylpolyglutamate synthase/dihydropteroate synthase
VNLLLNDRSEKFGQYDESLRKRTGIFGLKTKKDMQQSIDILTEIVRTDNEVFRELKILLDYKDLEKNQTQERYSETESRSHNFMVVINKLQDQNELLKAELKKSETQSYSLVYILIALDIFVAGLLLYLFRAKKLTFK